MKVVLVQCCCNSKLQEAMQPQESWEAVPAFSSSSSKSSHVTPPHCSGVLHEVCCKLQCPEAKPLPLLRQTGEGGLHGAKWWGLQMRARIFYSFSLEGRWPLSLLFLQSMCSVTSKPVTQFFLWYFSSLMPLRVEGKSEAENLLSRTFSKLPFQWL